MGKMKELLIDLANDTRGLMEDYDLYSYRDAFDDDEIAFESTMEALCKKPDGVLDFLDEVIANTKGCDDDTNTRMFQKAYSLKRQVERICL